MVKRTAVLFSALVCNMHAGNTFACLKATGERVETVVKAEVDNGDAKAVAAYIAAKAVPKLLANENVDKFMAKTHLEATKNDQGGYNFSLLGVQVAATDAQPDAPTLAAQLVPHIATALVTAQATQAGLATSVAAAASSVPVAASSVAASASAASSSQS